MLRYARLMPADWHLLSLQLESRQRAVAASAGFKAGAEALSVQPAPAEANNSRTEVGLRTAVQTMPLIRY